MLGAESRHLSVLDYCNQIYGGGELAGRCAMTIAIPLRLRISRVAVVSASSPSASRFEFGSSMRTTNGSP